MKSPIFGEKSLPATCLLLFSAMAGSGLFFASPAIAIDLTDEFDGAAVNPAVWEATGGKSVTVTGGRLTWAADGGNWASGDLSSVNRFFLPPAGQTTVIEWTLGPNAITVQNPNAGQSLRQQIGIHSANETATRREHWNNSTGGVWLDIDNIAAANPTGAVGAVRTANDTKVANSAATLVAGVTIPNWNWQTEAHLFRLEITSTGFTFFNGATSIGNTTWAAAGIDTEFGNGFRVLALGMNFDAGRGTTAVERISVTNAFGPPSIITSFSSSLAAPVAGEKLNLSWVVDPAASVSLDRGIGNVDAMTGNGAGTLSLLAPVVTTPMAIVYTLTAVKGAVTATRAVTLNVKPPPPLFLEDFLDHFEGSTLNAANWEHRGDRTYTVANSRINWNGDGTNWSHGEVDSVPVFPLPPAGKPTRIIWTLGPGSVSVVGPDGNALRPMLGIFSTFERHTWSRQHWQNTTGGIWLDILGMGNNRATGVTGNLYYANDTKIIDSNATDIGGFDVADWNWGTENHAFSLVVTDVGYTWFSGENQLGTGTWAAAGLDHEFSNGFRIMMMAANFDTGRGPLSLDAVQVINGAAIGEPFVITSVVHDHDLGTTRLVWNSEPNAFYSIDYSSNLAAWIEAIDGIPSGGATTTYTHTMAGGELYLRVRKQ